MSTTHRGGCHCGAIRYTVSGLDLSKPTISCNCSMCGRAGTLLQFVPASAFTLDQGDSNLADYQFARHVIHHLFCKTCGIKSFSRGMTAKGEPTVAINVRCLDDIDTFTIPTKQFDGKNM